MLDTVTLGLGSMIGAGIFVALAPAAAAAGTSLLIGLVIAAAVACCNAMSSARLAARYPQSGGAYVYGRERLGAFWGHTAGWSFVVGKTASCAAMALTVGYYVWPTFAPAVAVASVVALTTFGYAGIQKSALLTRAIVALVLAVLAMVVVVVLGFGDVDANRLIVDDVAGRGVLEAAGLLFFAFAGYARIATLGEEVRDPPREPFRAPSRWRWAPPWSSTRWLPPRFSRNCAPPGSPGQMHRWPRLCSRPASRLWYRWSAPVQQ